VEATESRLRSPDGTELFWRAWPLAGARATLAVVHGLGEHSGRYAEFARAMASDGYAVSALDLRGHGQSQGQRGHVDSWSDWVDDLVTFVAEVQSQATGEVVPVGHSFGAAVLLDGVVVGRVEARRFVVSSPALRAAVRVPGWKVALGRVSSRVAPGFALSNGLDASHISREQSVVDAYVNDPLVHDRISSRTYTEWQAAIGRIMAGAAGIQQPFFASHGAGDQLIDPAGTEDFYARTTVPGRLLKIYPDRYHEPYNDIGREEVFQDLAAWLDRQA
jgi:alpha-beta hydrolase superfamily lysophospholipase